MFDENNKEQRNTFYFVPPKPIRKFIYLCDKSFHTELIEELYQTYDDYGILYLSGCEYCFYVLNGNDLYEITKTTRKRLPKTHRRGGQSQGRFARLREEAIHNYLVKVNEASVDLFINPKTTLPNIKGLIIIGAGNKKEQFQDMLDQRLKPLLLSIVTSDHLDTDTAVKIVSDYISVCNNRIVKDIMSDDEHLEYGQKEILEKLEDGYLETIIITDEKLTELDDQLINIKEKCKLVSCQLHVINNFDVQQMGGIIGKTWF
jgi:peptide chain release factor subunit 1